MTSIEPIEDNCAISPSINIRERDLEHLPDMVEEPCQNICSTQLEARDGQPLDGCYLGLGGHQSRVYTSTLSQVESALIACPRVYTTNSKAGQVRPDPSTRQVQLTFEK